MTALRHERGFVVTLNPTLKRYKKFQILIKSVLHFTSFVRRVVFKVNDALKLDVCRNLC
jgi:hypothetical protein